MLILGFQGWFQCRLATDPDPTDDPRGVSGPTSVLPGEPVFDRVIRFNDPVAPRYPLETAVGVKVNSVSVGGQTVPNHPLLGATVDLLDAAKFEGRNFVIAQGGQEPIDPFHIQIKKGTTVIARKDLWDPSQPDLDILKVPPAVLKRRQPVSFSLRNTEVAEATGIMDYAGYRQQRKALLERKLLETKDPVQRAALVQRIDDLKKDPAMVGITLATLAFLGAQEIFQYDINGPIRIEDPKNNLKGQIGTSQPWPIKFWLGGYDVDTLCGYASGQLSLPFRPA